MGAFLHHNNTFTYLYPVSTGAGKEAKAMFFILDTFIAKHAGKSEWIDFEGSDIEGVKRFYLGFGASVENYYRLKINNLPGFIRIFKKIN